MQLRHIAWSGMKRRRGRVLFMLSAVALAIGTVVSLAALSAAVRADIAAAREDIEFAQSKLERQQQLWDRGFTTRADYEAAQHAVAQAREQLRIAQAEQALREA